MNIAVRAWSGTVRGRESTGNLPKEYRMMSLRFLPAGLHVTEGYGNTQLLLFKEEKEMKWFGNGVDRSERIAYNVSACDCQPRQRRMEDAQRVFRKRTGKNCSCPEGDCAQGSPRERDECSDG